MAGSFGHYNVIPASTGTKSSPVPAAVCSTDDRFAAEKVRKWSTQSREAAPWYQHEELGYNYRMSNVVAGIIRGRRSTWRSISRRSARYGSAIGRASVTCP